MKTSMSQQEFELALLGSARGDRVPEGARERVAGRLGLGAGGAGAARAAASTSSLTKPALLGVTGIGALGLVLWSTAPAPVARPASVAVPAYVATVEARAPSSVSSSAPPSVAATRPAPPEPEHTEAAPAHEPPRSPSSGRAARPKIKPSAPRSAATSDTSAPRRKSASEGLLEEVKQLDRARADLAGERTSLALAVLDDYERRFPEGQLALEASVLRASTLAQSGRTREARALAERLLARSDSARYRAELAPIAGHDRRADDIEGAR